MAPDGNAGTFLIALGGFIGFSGAFLCSLKLGHGDVSSSLLRASIGMLVGGGLMKVLMSAIYGAARDAQRERREKRAAESQRQRDTEEAASQSN